jgi:hypothetical protein
MRSGYKARSKRRACGHTSKEGMSQDLKGVRVMRLDRGKITQQDMKEGCEARLYMTARGARGEIQMGMW